MITFAPWVRIASWCLVVVCGALAVIAGWDRGADPLIDFGRELYVPWRLVEGEVLHRDLAWFNGPLGPWVVEGWMRVFGVSLDAVQALNTVVIAATTVLLALVVRRIADEFTAWACSIVFLCAFAVAQQEGVGNFLFLAPYSHGITFGFVCGLGMLYALDRASVSERVPPVFVAGVCAGLAFLTKAEIFLAVAISGATMLIAMGLHRGRWLALAASFTGGFTLPVAWAGARFWSELGPYEVPVALAGTWFHAFDEDVAELPFYKMMRGTDDLAASLARVAFYTASAGVFLTSLFAVARFVARRTRHPIVAGLAGLGLALTATTALFIVAPIKWMLLPLVVVLPLHTVSAARRFLRVKNTSRAPRAILLLGFAVFAIGLLPKVMFVPLVRQYGFVLSVPGAMILVALIVRWIPLGMGGSPRAVAAVRGAGVGVALMLAALNANATRNWFAKKTATVGAEPDRIISDGWRGPVLAALVRDLDRRLDPDDELLVLPEGISLNYLLRRRTPTRLVNFVPPEIAMFGEDEVIEALETRPPEIIVLVHRPLEHYGYEFFGQGYGERILAWVRDHYELAHRIGHSPFEPGIRFFGADILVPR